MGGRAEERGIHNAAAVPTYSSVADWFEVHDRISEPDY